jgi:hypothetical protein
MIKRPLLGLVVSFVLGMLLHELKVGYVIAICVMQVLLFGVLSIAHKNTITKRLHIVYTKEDWHRYLWPVFLLIGFFRLNQVMMVSDFEHNLVSKREGSLQGEVIDIKQTSNAISILIDHARIRLS